MRLARSYSSARYSLSAARPVGPATGLLLFTHAWRRLASLDAHYVPSPWVNLPSFHIAKLPHQAPRLGAQRVLDAGFFFPLTPESPFAELAPDDDTFSYQMTRSPARARRADVAKTKRPRKKKSSSSGFVLFATPENALRKYTKNHPIRKKKAIVRRARRRRQLFAKVAIRRALCFAPHTLTPQGRVAKPDLPSLAVSDTPLYFIPQTRFKPGFRAQWRLLRYDYARSLSIRATRQVRITRYVATLRALRGFAFIRTLAMTAGFILRQANLVSLSTLRNTLRTALQVISETGWALNHRPLRNFYLQVYPGDLLAKTSGAKIIDTRPHRAVWAQGRRLRHENLLDVFSMRPTGAAPWFLEVDELSLTVGVISAPLRLSDLDPAFWHAFPFLSHRMLNWKYRY